MRVCPGERLHKVVANSSERRYHMKRFFTEHEKTLWLLLLFACMFFLGRGIGAIVYGLHMQQEMSPRETVGSALENTQEVLSAENWGLGFGTEGTQPTGTASAEELKEYNAYYVGDAEEKKIYLTFDCGYENGNSSAILDALKKHDAPATFFVVGHFLESAPEMVKRMVEDGHTVGNHTYHNYDMSKNEDIQQYNNILIDLDLEEGDSSPDEPDDNEPVEPDDPIVPDDSVSVKNPVIKVDISLIEKEYVIEIPSDFIDAGGEGDGGDDNEGGDTVAKPTIVGDAGLDISQPIEISGAGNKTVRVKINTPGKLASLVVKITSSTLEALLPAVGLTSEFDICDEGLKETLSKLGLSATKGATSTTFDISSFMPMIAGLGGGDYLFTITATDQLGQKASKTLTVRNLND